MSIFGIFNTEDDNKNENHDTVSDDGDNSRNTSNDSNNTQTSDQGTLLLHKEELDINKNRVQKGEVELSKEIVEEQKVIDVPVTHEEVVIERRPVNNETSDSPISDEETIRIPVSEEQVQVGKHTVVTAEVSAYKREVEETQHLEETLKREEAHLNKTGNPDVIGDKSNSPLK